MDHQTLKRYFQGQLSEHEKKVVEDWLNQQEDFPSGMAYYDEVKIELWTAITHRIESKPDITKKRSWHFPTIAATVLLALGIIAGLYYEKQRRSEETIAWKTVEVPFGKRMQLVLADQTEILLSGGSAIAYAEQKKGDLTTVCYLKGEIYVSVTPKSHRPFEVQLPGQKRIFVLGTAFNIYTNEDNQKLTVTLAEGKIRFENKDKKAYLLQPGEQLINDKTDAIQVKRVNIDQEIAWKDHWLWFDETPVTEVFSRLEREYGISIDTKSTISEQRITAKFQQAPLDKVLRLLEESTQIHFKRKGNTVIAF